MEINANIYIITDSRELMEKATANIKLLQNISSLNQLKKIQNNNTVRNFLTKLIMKLLKRVLVFKGHNIGDCYVTL